MIALSVLLALGAAQDVRLELSVEPAEARIGEPLAWTLRATHDRGRRVLARDLDLALDDSWVVVEGPAARARRLASGETLTEVRWTVLSLEPRASHVAALEVPFDVGPAGSVEGEPFTVLGELAEGEDAPRPLPGFHTVEERTGPVRPRHLGAGAALFAVLAGGWLFARRGRARAEPEPTELERFAGLDRTGRDDPARVRALMYELSALLRIAAERRLGESLAARSDEEWVAAARASGRLPDALVDELERVLAECAAVKYAGARPTRFAVDDVLRRAEALLSELSARAAGEDAA